MSRWLDFGSEAFEVAVMVPWGKIPASELKFTVFWKSTRLGNTSDWAMAFMMVPTPCLRTDLDSLNYEHNAQQTSKENTKEQSLREIYYIRSTFYLLINEAWPVEKNDESPCVGGCLIVCAVRLLQQSKFETYILYFCPIN